MEAKVCPVCNGKMVLPPGFYDLVANPTPPPTAAPEQCRSCGGRGYIVILT